MLDWTKVKFATDNEIMAAFAAQMYLLTMMHKSQDYDLSFDSNPKVYMSHKFLDMELVAVPTMLKDEGTNAGWKTNLAVTCAQIIPGLSNGLVNRAFQTMVAEVEHQMAALYDEDED